MVTPEQVEEALVIKLRFLLFFAATGFLSSMSKAMVCSAFQPNPVLMRLDAERAIYVWNRIVTPELMAQAARQKSVLQLKTRDAYLSGRVEAVSNESFRFRTAKGRESIPFREAPKLIRAESVEENARRVLLMRDHLLIQQQIIFDSALVAAVANRRVRLLFRFAEDTSDPWITELFGAVISIEDHLVAVDGRAAPVERLRLYIRVDETRDWTRRPKEKELIVFPPKEKPKPVPLEDGRHKLLFKSPVNQTPVAIDIADPLLQEFEVLADPPEPAHDQDAEISRILFADLYGKNSSRQ